MGWKGKAPFGPILRLRSIAIYSEIIAKLVALVLVYYTNVYSSFVWLVIITLITLVLCQSCFLPIDEKNL